MPINAKEKIIVALDVPNRKEADTVLKKLTGHLNWIKIGLQLYTAEGPDIVRLARDYGFRVFLDLKFHDIPNTVQHAVQSAGALGVELLTVHTLGGPEMLKAAAEAANAANIRLLGVTLLTSMDAPQCAAIGLPTEIPEQVLRLGNLAKNSGLQGVVASPLETEMLRKNLGKDFCLVIPGIRPAGTALGDQKRILSPADAIRAGASYLVIGRPITAAPDLMLALAAIDDELQAVKM